MQFVNQRKWFYKRFNKKSKVLKLGFNNLYIFPNLFGLYWIITTIALFILGTNLEANFTIFISYLMVTVFLISLFLTHFNLHGLELYSINQSINYANSKTFYEIRIFSNKYRNNLKIKFINKNCNFIKLQHVEGEMGISLVSEKKDRGIYIPDLIYGESSSPLSLCNCWFYWRPTDKIIIAPEIMKGNSTIQNTIKKNNSNNLLFNFSEKDQLDDIKNFKRGDRKANIYWKSLARQKILSTKTYLNEAKDIKWLILNKSIPLEIALKNLCFEIHNEYLNNNTYGIKLDKQNEILPNRGKDHYFKNLYNLALYKK